MDAGNGLERRRIAFVSSNDVWGGSEELWSRAAIALARAGHRVSSYKPRVKPSDPRAKELTAAGCAVADIRGPQWLPRKLKTLLALMISRFIERRLAVGLRSDRAELVLISQGLNHDGWYAGRVCRRLRIPYVLISQKASDLYWPTDDVRAALCEAYRHAAAALFVSEHNLRLTEEQLGFALPQARVVRNPFNVAAEVMDVWPDDRSGIRLVCLARLDVREKGQDLLIRVMAMPKWRARPISVDFYGSGHHEMGLRAMVAALGLESVRFAGFADRPETIWEECHGLILPSRCEGLPLSLVEAMLHARIAIATDVGGNREALIDGVTGFLADAPTEAALDAALERAWAKRAEWPAMGRVGQAHAREMVAVDPVDALVDDILAMLGGSRPDDES